MAESMLCLGTDCQHKSCVPLEEETLHFSPTQTALNDPQFSSVQDGICIWVQLPHSEVSPMVPLNNQKFPSLSD